jgi:hypothetical protein
VHLDVPHRQYQDPRVFEQRVNLKLVFYSAKSIVVDYQ